MPLTEDWYTLRRRLHSPTRNTGLMIFCVFIISLNSGKLCTRHENLPLALLSPLLPPLLTCTSPCRMVQWFPSSCKAFDIIARSLDIKYLLRNQYALFFAV